METVFRPQNNLTSADPVSTTAHREEAEAHLAVYRWHTAPLPSAACTECCLSCSATWWRSRRWGSWPGCPSSPGHGPPAWRNTTVLSRTEGRTGPRTEPPTWGEGIQTCSQRKRERNSKRSGNKDITSRASGLTRCSAAEKGRGRAAPGHHCRLTSAAETSPCQASLPWGAENNNTNQHKISAFLFIRKVTRLQFSTAAASQIPLTFNFCPTSSAKSQHKRTKQW